MFDWRRKDEWLQLVRYYAAGLVNMAFGYIVFALLIWAGVEVFTAQAVGYVLGVAFNYFTYSRFAFAGHSVNKVNYVASYIANYLAGVALLVTANIAAARDITIAQSSDLRSNNPGVNRDGNTDGVILHIVEGLVGYNNAGEVKPLLAESVDVSPDGLTYTFKLRKDVKFHNGKPLTAEDVVWNWTRYLKPETK